MAIAGCDFTTFATRLNEVLTLSVPVRTPEKLFGREKQLETIQLALHSPVGMYSSMVTEVWGRLLWHIPPHRLFSLQITAP